MFEVRLAGSLGQISRFVIREGVGRFAPKVGAAAAGMFGAVAPWKFDFFAPPLRSLF